MTARHLPSTITMQCFEAAARHMSFTRAADELSITQSAVSKQVAQLEAYLQHKLFRRVRRTLILTPEGSLYLTEVRKILAQIEMSANTIMTYSGQGEVLRVACLPTFGARWLARQLPDFLDANPHIDLSVRDHVEAFDLDQEDIDVAIFHGHGSWPNLECHKLFDEEVVAVGAPDYLARRQPTSAADLAECRLLHLSTRPDAWHRWFADQGITTERSYHGTRFETFQMLIRTAMSGGGLALVPRFFVDAELAEGRLSLAWPHVLKGPDAYYLVHPEHLGELSRVRRFVAHVLACAEDDTPAGTSR
ncbi:LysR substrate-binding domain-containing protein [Chromohalobacter israelensis]|uniref:LysR substrate-binding domain-containing protein n=1 Tax=Chromohalobacter israelensis TaxID=141390 RepID=UPI0015C4670A|nr:LysR substrate-binding domain-containing protein [Chromohalobacter salexigens]NWO56106.1 LysR family transcriptional regulator [Chromohalobacter salexigens]